MSNFIRVINGLYISDLERRHKMCSYCGTQFCDISKRNVGSTCTKECASALMSYTRHENGSYVRTEEQNRLMSESLRRTNREDPTINDRRSASLLKTFAERPESRKLLSEKVRQRWNDGWVPNVPKGDDHWTRQPGATEKLSANAKGNKLTPEQRAKCSQKAQERHAEGNFTRGKGGFREDLGCYFRSRWEANFARVLNEQGKKWLYEKVTFQLSETMSYTPDFFVDGCFYEVKGWWTERAKETFQLFRELFPQFDIRVVDNEMYKELRQQYKEVVTWEE